MHMRRSESHHHHFGSGFTSKHALLFLLKCRLLIQLALTFLQSHTLCYSMLFCRVIPSYSEDLYIWESCKNVFQVQQAGLVRTVRKLGLVKKRKISQMIHFMLLKTSRKAPIKIQENKKTQNTLWILFSFCWNPFSCFWTQDNLLCKSWACGTPTKHFIIHIMNIIFYIS